MLGGEVSRRRLCRFLRQWKRLLDRTYNFFESALSFHKRVNSVEAGEPD